MSDNLIEIIIEIKKKSLMERYVTKKICKTKYRKNISILDYLQKDVPECEADHQKYMDKFNELRVLSCN